MHSTTTRAVMALLAALCGLTTITATATAKAPPAKVLKATIDGKLVTVGKVVRVRVEKRHGHVVRIRTTVKPLITKAQAKRAIRNGALTGYHGARIAYTANYPFPSAEGVTSVSGSALTWQNGCFYDGNSNYNRYAYPQLLFVGVARGARSNWDGLVHFTTNGYATSNQYNVECSTRAQWGTPFGHEEGEHSGSVWGHGDTVTGWNPHARLGWIGTDTGYNPAKLICNNASFVDTEAACG